MFQTPQPQNEQVKSYAPGTPEREEIRKELRRMRGERIDIPLVIGGKEIRTNKTGRCIVPHDHEHVLATYSKAGREEALLAVEAAAEAWKTWSRTSWEERVAVSLRAAELLANSRRFSVNAAAMLNISKTVHQAEIDAVCEMNDFLRMNTYFMQQIYKIQPENFQATWNRLEYRALEGFVLAISPFNFASVGANLAMAPVLMGNVALWKPSSTGVYPAYQLMCLFREAGLPDGVINFVPGDAAEIGDVLLRHPTLAGVHFTGSNAAFDRIWQTVGENISRYRSYPRIVGETGGKDFLVAHPSADVRGLVACAIRGAFEYQGQKCSATSRAYFPKSRWPEIRDLLGEELSKLRVGPVEDFGNFMGAVIDRASFENIRGHIEYARARSDCKIVFGGRCDGEKGFFVDPTVILTEDPHCRLMEEEIFGPVLSVHLYEDDDFERTLDLCDATSPYALTGSIFASDRQAILLAEEKLRNAAGNFYINDKTTGAVVGHQPFGGARASGTNDKAGSIFNLLRWISVRTIKECFRTPQSFGYPFLSGE